MKVEQSKLPGQIITIYTPVVFTDGPRAGELGVQITSPEGHFLGWADGLGKYDKQGKGGKSATSGHRNRRRNTDGRFRAAGTIQPLRLWKTVSNG